jgi:hypothetical protein
MLKSLKNVVEGIGEEEKTKLKWFAWLHLVVHVLHKIFYKNLMIQSRLSFLVKLELCI